MTSQHDDSMSLVCMQSQMDGNGNGEVTMDELNAFMKKVSHRGARVAL